MRPLQWIKPPFLDDDGKWKDTTTDEKPEGDWPWVGDKFLAAVQLSDGPGGKPRWDFCVVMFTEVGIETGEGECWCWEAEDISWITRLDGTLEAML